MYIKILFYILPLLFTINSFSKEIKTIAYLDEIFDDLKYKNSELLLEEWINGLTVDTPFKADIKVYKNIHKMIDDYINKKIDILVLNPYYYLVNEKKLIKNTTTFLTLQQNKDFKLERIYIVTNKNSNINKLSDLNNKKIVMRKTNYLGKVFLDTEYFRKSNKNPNELIDNVHYVNDNTFLIKTYFGLYDACIINSYYYKIMLELNPSIMKKTKILSSSPRIFNNHMLLYNKSNTKDDMKVFLNKLNSFLEGLKKNELFDLIKINHVSEFKPANIKKLSDYFSKYQEITIEVNKR